MSSILPIPIADIPPLGTTLGAIYVGATIGAVFYGITILQTVIYYKQYPNDPWLFRYSIALLWILDTLHVAISTHALYFYLIDSFGNYFPLFGIIWSFPLQLLVNMLIVVGVQALYAVRIWKFGRNYHVVLPWFIFLAVAASLATGIYVIYDTYTLSSFFQISTISTSIYVVFSTLAGADFIIATTMCYYLRRGASRTNFFDTTKIIVGLMRLVVISGLATSACSLFVLIAYIAWPNSLIFIAVDFILPKLYINSLLAMLNARNAQMKPGTQGRPIDGSKILRFAPQISSSAPSDSLETNIDIALSVMERSRSNDGTENMMFA
ncbi:uncharacterized protein EV420DRAFT_515083 [Desarmillaria tabescens]|uniref:DUF6534 domain-containing protein n=1 Tax=Armillaria tabescens TaxID=1929756 RepID=A0AA39K9V1_ARMTA|nr:uncharacterized protein EV420DRAFT_515083 [Desarmillaria tabescens]KAK0457251.1 hypothetical protein EV420DRAFT_515083 [Desarmillaria tabescens]